MCAACVCVQRVCVCILGLAYLIAATFVWIFVVISQHSRYKYSALNAVIKLIWE